MDQDTCQHYSMPGCIPHPTSVCLRPQVPEGILCTQHTQCRIWVKRSADGKRIGAYYRTKEEALLMLAKYIDNTPGAATFLYRIIEPKSNSFG